MTRTPSRAAFTLLEVLLALALAGVLLTAVWTSLSLFFRYSEAGRQEADQLQVARAIFQAVEHDLRSSVPPPETQPATLPTGSASSTSQTSSGSSASGASGLSGSSSSTGTSSTGSASGTTTPATPPLIFIGDEQAFVFQSLLPQSFEQSALGQAAGKAPAYRRDLQWVGWSATGELPANVPSGSPIPPPPPQEQIDGRSQLIRWQMDVLGNATESAAASPATFPIPPEVIPEILRFRLRYYSGVEWVDEWQSDKEGGLPIAVEIEMDVASYAEIQAVRESHRESRPRDAEFQTYRLVVPLPISTSIRPPSASSS